MMAYSGLRRLGRVFGFRHGRFRPLLSCCQRSSTSFSDEAVPPGGVRPLASSLDYQELRNKIQSVGFGVTSTPILSPLAVQAVRDRFEPLFRGDFETNIYPDEWHWRKGISLPTGVTREICNAYKADRTIARVILSPTLAAMVAKVMGWSSVRIAQDDILWKPPMTTSTTTTPNDSQPHREEANMNADYSASTFNATTVGFHQDSAYISSQFVPFENNSVTVWIALDLFVSRKIRTHENLKSFLKWRSYTLHVCTNHKADRKWLETGRDCVYFFGFDVKSIISFFVLVIMSKKEDIIERFEELSIKDGKCSALQREIDLAGFQIFKCISDHGFYSFTPPRGSPSYKDLSEYKNKFPYGQQEIASLHVAVKDRNVDLSDIDFVFLGSTLEMLANCETKTPFLLTLIPGTQAIIVKKLDEYDVDFAHPAFQFHRLVTGKRLDDHSSVMDSVDHFQVMQVGKYRVLFFSGTDAVLGDDMTPVKVKASNPFNWGTRVLFQMIASGSTTVCYGIKRKDWRTRKNQLTEVNLKSLSRVAKEGLNRCNVSIEEIEQNIIQGMTKMKDVSLVEGSDYKIYFDEDKSLQVELMEDNSRTIFPSPSITRELID